MYKLTNFDCILRLSDNASIPFADGNADYEDYKAWLAAGNAPDPAEDRAAILARQWDAIKNRRDALIASGGVQVSGKWFQTDTTSRIQWIRMESKAQTALLKGGAGGDAITVGGTQVLWKTMDGSFIGVTNDLAIAVVEAVELNDAQIFTVAETKRQQLNAAADPASFDVQSGWPAAYGDAA